MRGQKIIVDSGKVLRLNHVLMLETYVDEIDDFQIIVKKMQNYILLKGRRMVGPFIQTSKHIVDENGRDRVAVKFLQQLDTDIHSCESPYSMKSVIKISNCLYTKFVGAESDLRYAYNKIELYAYENNIELNGENYTVFVGKEDDRVIVDIFMSIKDERL